MIRTAGILAVHISKACQTTLNDIVELDQQQIQEEERQRIAKRKHDEYALAILTAAEPAFSACMKRFWVDVRSNEWNTLLLNRIMLQDEQFEKTFRMSRNSFVVLHDLLSITPDNYFLLHAFRTLHYETRYMLASSYFIPNSLIFILVVRHSRFHIPPFLYAPWYWCYDCM
jgi:hypothetical protein